jgi:hypothetical protein
MWSTYPFLIMFGLYEFSVSALLMYCVIYMRLTISVFVPLFGVFISILCHLYQLSSVFVPLFGVFISILCHLYQLSSVCVPLFGVFISILCHLYQLSSVFESSILFHHLSICVIYFGSSS